MKLSQLVTFMALMVWTSLISHLRAMSIQDDSPSNASMISEGNLYRKQQSHFLYLRASFYQ